MYNNENPPQVELTPENLWGQICHSYRRLKLLEKQVAEHEARISEHETSIKTGHLDKEYLKKELSELKTMYKDSFYKLEGIERRFIEEEGVMKFKHKLGKIFEVTGKIIVGILSIGVFDYVFRKYGLK